MASTKPENPAAAPEKPSGGRKKLIIILAAVPLILGAAGGGAYFWFHGHAEKTSATAENSPAAPAKPVFVDLPEMSVTLPNNGQPRQLRIRLSLELATKGSNPPQASALSPIVYDMMLTYLRTLTDSEIQGSLAIDRVRGDLYRRLNLLLGPNVVRDVLITSLITA